jgi:polysaccharide pyruvyl transferase WcaK-like protein
MRAYDGIFLPDLDRATLSAAEQTVVEHLTCRQAGQPLIGFNLRLWFHFCNSILPYHWARAKFQERSKQPMDRLIAAAVEAVAQLRRRTGARIVLLSMYEPESNPWEDDLPHLRRVKNSFSADGEVVLLEQALGLGGVCRLVEHFDLMIGTRLHSTLTALRLGVPAINLAYTLKCRDIFGDLGLAANAVELEHFIANPAAVAQLAAALLADRGAPLRIRRTVAELCAENLQVLGEVLSSVQTPDEGSGSRAA